MDKKISEYRSDVIEKSINIEWLINAIISQHYFKKIVAPFVFEMLYDVNCTFALKRNVLQKIAPRFTNLDKLNRLNNIRNIFAHCNQEVFVLEGENKWKVLNPKDTNKELDFEKLYQEFIAEEGPLTIALGKLLIELGGQLYENGTNKTLSDIYGDQEGERG